MERRHYIAAWVLLGLVAAGVVVPPIVIFVLQPKRVTVEEVKIDGVLPLDVFILIDSSFSIGRPDWELALDFGRKVSIQLQERLPRVRAGMGQFATKYQMIRSLSENLSDWSDLSDIQKLKGQTGMAHGLCGDSVGNPFGGCTGGAYAQLVNAPPPKPNSSLDCGENVTALRAVLIVTDGVTADPDVMVEAARFVKNENVTVMGILVKSTEDKELDAAELYTLSSCCPSNKMELAMLRPDWPPDWQRVRPNCTAEKDSACPFLAMSADYEALGKTVDKIASQVDQVLVCERKEITKVFESDWGTLWFLLLLAPAILFLCWQNVLLCLSKSEHFAREVRASLAARRHELEMSTATEGLAAASDAADLAAEAGKAAEGAEASGGSAAPAAAAGEGGPDAENPSTGKKMVGFAGEAGDDGEGGATGSSGPGEGGLDAAGEGRRSTRVSEGAALSGKKWAPVRTAYIIGGQRMNVDYGRGSLPPPAAQLGAHRGMDEWDEEQDGQLQRGDPSERGLSFHRKASRKLSRAFSRQMTKQFTNLDIRPAGLENHEVAPPLRKCNFSVLVPLVLTVLLVPLVIWKSGILNLFTK